MSAMAISEPRVHPWRAPHLAACFHMMKWALVGSVLVSLACVAVAIPTGGSRAVYSVVIGSLAVIGFFASGMPVQLLAMGQQLQQGIGIVVLCYASRVATLGLLLLSMTGNGMVARPDLMPMVWAIVATTVAWVVGLLAGHHHARVPVFDTPRADHRDTGR